MQRNKRLFVYLFNIIGSDFKSLVSCDVKKNYNRLLLREQKIYKTFCEHSNDVYSHFFKSSYVHVKVSCLNTVNISIIVVCSLEREPAA